MRKYFLLSTVALMMATNANATAVGGSFSATAELIEATTISCSQNLNFGTIVFTEHYNSGEGGGYAMITPDGETKISNDVVSMTGATPALCSADEDFGDSAQIVIHGGDDSSYQLKLTDTTTNKTTCASVSYKIQGSDIYFGGAIDGACGMYAGTYTGTVTFSVIY
ncbi:MAG: DUF4402 domain-containing protein [Alphaproteobacteria bacterium]|nr:DUF4402 domain-containing protein [Alphaproteobacteria bacterium]